MEVENQTNDLQPENGATPAAPAVGTSSDQGAPFGSEPVEGVDLSGVPEAVRAQVVDRLKAMRADHSRKTQEASDRLKEAEALRQKAALADLILQNPALAKNLNGGGQPSSDEDDEDEAAIAALQPEAVKGVKALLKRWQKTELAPVYDPHIRRLSAIDRKMIKQEMDSVHREFPEAKGQEAKIAAFCQANPGIDDYRTAVMGALGAEILDARSKAQAAKSADLTMRQNAQTIRNGTPAPQTQPKDKPRFSRLAEAIAAYEESKKAGRS